MLVHSKICRFTCPESASLSLCCVVYRSPRSNSKSGAALPVPGMRISTGNPTLSEASPYGVFLYTMTNIKRKCCAKRTGVECNTSRFLPNQRRFLSRNPSGGIGKRKQSRRTASPRGASVKDEYLVLSAQIRCFSGCYGSPQSFVFLTS